MQNFFVKNNFLILPIKLQMSLLVILVFLVSVVVWDLEKKEALCGAPAAVLSAGVTFCVAFGNISDHTFVTGGK